MKPSDASKISDDGLRELLYRAKANQRDASILLDKAIASAPKGRLPKHKFRELDAARRAAGATVQELQDLVAVRERRHKEIRKAKLAAIGEDYPGLFMRQAKAILPEALYEAIKSATDDLLNNIQIKQVQP
jgi:hypothetical protein